MISLVTKFLDWVKDIFSLIISLPVKFADLCNFVGSTLGFLPSGLGSIIAGLLLTCIVFVMIFSIVKLVVSLL